MEEDLILVDSHGVIQRESISKPEAWPTNRRKSSNKFHKSEIDPLARIKTKNYPTQVEFREQNGEICLAPGNESVNKDGAPASKVAIPDNKTALTPGIAKGATSLPIVQTTPVSNSGPINGVTVTSLPNNSPPVSTSNAPASNVTQQPVAKVTHSATSNVTQQPVANIAQSQTLSTVHPHMVNAVHPSTSNITQAQTSSANARTPNTLASPPKQAIPKTIVVAETQNKNLPAIEDMKTKQVNMLTLQVETLKTQTEAMQKQINFLNQQVKLLSNHIANNSGIAQAHVESKTQTQTVPVETKASTQVPSNEVKAPIANVEVKAPVPNVEVKAPVPNVEVKAPIPSVEAKAPVQTQLSTIEVKPITEIKLPEPKQAATVNEPVFDLTSTRLKLAPVTLGTDQLQLPKEDDIIQYISCVFNGAPCGRIRRHSTGVDFNLVIPGPGPVTLFHQDWAPIRLPVQLQIEHNHQVIDIPLLLQNNYYVFDIPKVNVYPINLEGSIDY